MKITLFISINSFQNNAFHFITVWINKEVKIPGTRAIVKEPIFQKVTQSHALFQYSYAEISVWFMIKKGWQSIKHLANVSVWNWKLTFRGFP